jgi:hypothetical protein
MPYIGINTGTTPNDGTGDTLIQGAAKINQQFLELYSSLGVKNYTVTNTSKTIDLNEFCVVTAAGVQLQLPSVQTDGSTVQVCIVGTFTNTQVLRPAALGSGVKIMGLAEDFTIDQSNATVTLVGIQTVPGTASSFDWRIV